MEKGLTATINKDRKILAVVITLAIYFIILLHILSLENSIFTLNIAIIISHKKQKSTLYNAKTDG